MPFSWQAQIVINLWLYEYDHIRPHQSLNITPRLRNAVIKWNINVGLDRVDTYWSELAKLIVTYRVFPSASLPEYSLRD